MSTHPADYVFDIEYRCDECQEATTFEGTINDILCEMSTAGFPICPECGDDMDFYIMN